jgi:hypothetical protein
MLDFTWLCKLLKGCTQLTAASDKVYQLLTHGQWFSRGTLSSSTTKTGRHDIAEILLKVVLSTIIGDRLQLPNSLSHRGPLLDCHVTVIIDLQFHVRLCHVTKIIGLQFHVRLCHVTVSIDLQFHVRLCHVMLSINAYLLTSGNC